MGAIIAATLEPIPPHDYWWHLAMGREVAMGRLPSTNLFLYTLPLDEPFVNQPWLGQWLMWVAYDTVGHGATLLLRNIALALSFGLIIWTAWRRSGDARAAGGLGLLAAVLAYPVMTVRTRALAFVPFAVIVWVCVGVADGRLRRRWLAVAPVAAAFWANVHGSFILALALVGAAGVGVVVQDTLERRTVDVAQARDWALAIAGVALAGLANPLGPGVYAYVMQLTVESSVAHTVSEWRPPEIDALRGQIFAAAMLTTILILILRRAQVRLADVLMFGGTLVLAAGAIRSMFWWAALIPVVVGPHLAALLPREVDERTSRAERIGIAVALAITAMAVLAVQPGIARRAIGAEIQSGRALQSGEGAWLLNHEHPFAALKRLREDGRHRLFHDQAVGGLVEVELARPGATQVAFVDQRMEFIPEPVWERYFAISRGADGWEEELTARGVDTLLVTPDGQWGLVQAAIRSPDWQLRFVDQSHLLFYRRSLDGVQDPAEEQ